MKRKSNQWQENKIMLNWFDLKFTVGPYMIYFCCLWCKIILTVDFHVTGKEGLNHVSWLKSFVVFCFQITNFVVFICVICSEVTHISAAKWANFVSWVGLLVTAQFLIFHLLRITKVYSTIPWWKIEIGFAIIWGFFYLTVSVDLAMKVRW